jgi:hypothetical protein
VPRERLVEWKEEKMQWLKVHEEPFSEDEAKEFHERFTSRMEHWLDQGMGSCALREEKASGIVGEALRFFDEEKGDGESRYRLDEWVVMPNHVHVLCEPVGGNELSEILHSWKSYTANELNGMLGTKGEAF